MPFQSSNLKFEPTLKPYAIYLEDKMIGFAMYNSIKEELDSDWIYRIMIDKKYQRRGLGAIALKKLIDHMATLPDCTRITVGYHPENIATHQFYSKMGFIDYGDRFGNEMAVILKV